MEAHELYARMDKEFVTPKMSDKWGDYMKSVQDFLSDNYKQRWMGVVCDNAKVITKVYTAVFPTDEVMNAVLDKNESNIMLFVHHPCTWDIRKAPAVFQPMNRSLLQKFKESKISIFNYHVPLDNFGPYSTSNSLAKALEIKPEKPFAAYFGAMSGVIGKTEIKTVDELRKKLEKAIGHKASLYPYGDRQIRNGRVAIVAGGGNELDHLEEVVDAGVNTFITGITIKNDFSQPAHKFSEKHKISVMGGTHYSTEQFACKALCTYFTEELGLESEFIPGIPVMEDM